MNKDKKIRLMVGIGFLLIFILIILGYKSNAFIQKGELKPVPLNILGTTFFNFDDTYVIQLGTGKDSKPYLLQKYVKKRNHPLELKEEKSINMPSKSVYIGVEVDKPNITIKFFDKKQKLDEEHFFIECYDESQGKGELVEGNNWTQNVLEEFNRGKSTLLYAYHLQYYKKDGIGYVSEYEGMDDLLQGNLKEAVKNIKEGEYFLLTETE